jgi:hypothetical protein
MMGWSGDVSENLVKFIFYAEKMETATLSEASAQSSLKNGIS